MTVIRLRPHDAQRYIELRREMLEESPWAFGASPEDDVARDPAAVEEMLARPNGAVFAVEEPAAATRSQDAEGRVLIAAAGVVRQTRAKFVHRARIWGVYVSPEHRRRGLGRAVVAAAIELAGTWPGVDWVDLSVSSAAPGALRLYEALGFLAWGREPDATQVHGRRHDEIHMALRLHAFAVKTR
jgi:ribosomal protein S18 acetylase RimI-like enzyme